MTEKDNNSRVVTLLAVLGLGLFVYGFWLYPGPESLLLVRLVSGLVWALLPIAVIAGALFLLAGSILLAYIGIIAFISGLLLYLVYFGLPL